MAYENMFQRPTSLFFPSSTKFNSGNGINSLSNPAIMINGSNINSPNGMMASGSNHLMMNDVFCDEQEDQIVPDCSVAPKLDLSPMNEAWMNGAVAGASGSTSDASCASHGFLSTAVQLSLQEVSFDI